MLAGLLCAVRDDSISFYMYVEGTGAELFSEADWKRSDQSEIWDVPCDAELRGDVEQGPIPHDGAKAHIDTAQDSIRVLHDEICRLRVGQVSKIEARGNRAGRTDG